MPDLQTRLRGRLTVVCALAAMSLTVAEGAAAAESPLSLTTADYWAVADRIAAGFDASWDAASASYRWHGVPDIRTNANLLTAHAIAAYRRHRGPAREDARARALVDHLTRPPVWRGTGRPRRVREVSHPSTCWATDLRGTWPGHMSLEPKVASALAWAYRARRRLELAPAAARAIRATVSACARARAWRYPALMANQINWYAEMYASAATVTGSGALLRGDYRRQLARFARGTRRPMRGKRAANLGPGYSFRYRPDQPAAAPINVDSPEYAGIVLDAVSHYNRARRAGMRPLAPGSLRVMRAWIRRVLAGNWTHAGYLNWDTGHGFGRWHSAQYWAFAQQGLLAVARARDLWSGPDDGRWAKALFDRGLLLYGTIVEHADGGLETGLLFGVDPFFKDTGVFHSRMLANVTRAVAQGLGRARSADPPPFYAYDYDSGRLAISTPAYSTAVVPHSRGAFPYGGIELARLFASGQRVAANVGGRPPAAFGIVARPAGGGNALASQASSPRARLRLTESPRGRITHPKAYPARPYAGPFARVTAVGTVRHGPIRITTEHRFRPAAITERWRVANAGRRTSYEIAAHFPTWGGDGAAIDVRMRDGRVLRLAGGGADGGRPPLAEVAQITLSTGGGAGYAIVPLHAPAGALLRIAPGARQTSNPDPGPTLVVDLGSARPSASTELSVRLVPFAL